MSKLLILFAAFFAYAAHAGEIEDTFQLNNNTPKKATIKLDTEAYSAILKKYIKADDTGLNRFAYGKVSKADAKALQDYIAKEEKIDPTKLTKEQQFVYWANLYNAVTIHIILENYPVDSIKDIKAKDKYPNRVGNGLAFTLAGGPWEGTAVKVNGIALNLNNIEHKILRLYGDPRVHYAINCASIGCPNLQPKAWEVDTLDADLTAAAKAFINNPRGVNKLPNGDIEVSSIYKWFKEDFGKSNKNIIKHMLKYAEGDTKAFLKDAKKINSYQYNWNLNESK